MTKQTNKLEKVGYVLVLLMVLLQSFYGIFSLLEPSAFASLRGTELFAVKDTDWVQIYGSRTIFIALLLGYLLFTRNYIVLMWCALFGTVMPITDAFLAYEAHSPVKVLLKHIATVAYLFVTFGVLKAIVRKNIIS